ncbi:MAG: DUF438 domain-containing protein [Syntrophales bacterium]|nr:DUF438 domain-containing protein [Syntrophales bacterium]
MEITPKTNVVALIEAYPFLEEFLISLSDKFKLLRNPVMRNTVGKVATLEQAAVMGGLSVDDMVARLRGEVARQGAAVPSPSPHSREQRQELLRGIIKDLHDGLPLADAQKRFNEHFSDVSAGEIAAMEQALIAGGVSQSDVKRLCDVHVQVFKDALDPAAVPSMPEGHPVHTFMLENRASEKLLAKIEAILKNLASPPLAESYAQYRGNLTKLLESLAKVDIHYLRKENQLFPQLERHGITGPSQVMWGIHDDIRAMIKKTRTLMAGADIAATVAELSQAVQTIRDMIYKEEHILYPLSLEHLSDDEWLQVRRGEEEIGYAWIQPTAFWNPALAALQKESTPLPTVGRLLLDTGTPTLDQVRLMLTHLPLDISLVDENDEVIFYSANRDRIFLRSPGVIGRKVQNCHPPKSLDVVNAILAAFKSGAKESADFWIRSQDRFVYIRYIAVRDPQQRYVGCLEITQDVTAIRSLEGERRLLDWN